MKTPEKPHAALDEVYRQLVELFAASSETAVEKRNAEAHKAYLEDDTNYRREHLKLLDRLFAAEERKAAAYERIASALERRVM